MSSLNDNDGIACKWIHYITSYATLIKLDLQRDGGGETVIVERQSARCRADDTLADDKVTEVLALRALESP